MSKQKTKKINNRKWVAPEVSKGKREKAVEMYNQGVSMDEIRKAIHCHGLMINHIREWRNPQRSEHDVANRLKLAALRNRCCSIKDCKRQVHSRFVNARPDAEVYCLPHYREQCSIIAKKNCRRKKQRRKHKISTLEAIRRTQHPYGKPTEKERRKRIFASWKNPELDKLRKTEEYRVWRIAVVERDEYTCQHCEKTGGRLHAHHIKTFKMHEELRYEVSNGVTLCGKCHEDLHIANVDRKPFVIKMKAV